MRKRKRAGTERETFPPDSRVPPVAEWSPEGIVGRIRRGPLRGEYILVDTVWEREAGSGPIAGYILELPALQVFDESGDYVMDDGAYDVFRPAGEGGFIDLVTTALDVEWTTDQTVIRREWARRGF